MLLIKMMKQSRYNAVIAVLTSPECDGTTESISAVAQQFPGVSHRTLVSIYSQNVQLKTKQTHYGHSEAAPEYYQRYQERMAESPGQPVLLQMAREIDFPPALMARLVVEQYAASLPNAAETTPKGLITKYLKEPFRIEDPHLANQVEQCILMDTTYGPVVESIKHSVGNEYEFLLKIRLQQNNLEFLGEEDMRKKGYDKTPDIKLNVPIAVNGRIVNWIESKASFGDTHSHSQYMKDQFWSYVNRFGSGMVIYWFGFIQELDVTSEDGIMLAHDFPHDFIALRPDNT
ncbi:CDAN1-interacting nuclease 1-like [Amphiura filiformis]|uniref:CDAN1-interacting nuclease 1-like n=1 Tax=Amphiura filiformis TaxID=82378 RepID=UPI003B20EB1B